MGLTRTFQRPKGSASLAWTPAPGPRHLAQARRARSASCRSAISSRGSTSTRTRGNAGNVELVPQQSWNLDLEVKKDLGDWGSTTLKAYARWYEDYIDIIPVGGGGIARQHPERDALRASTG